MIGVVCGFQAEVECFHNVAAAIGLARTGYEIRPSGSSAAHARVQADSLIAEGATQLLSFGIAGSLSPRLRVGDVAHARHVVTTLDESYGKRPTREPIKALAVSNTIKPIEVSICGVDEVVLKPADKAALLKLSRAEVADMESHAVARAAQAAGIPFQAIRAISDGLDDELPAYVIGAVDQNGKPKLAPILLGLLFNPFSLGKLLALKKNTDTALAALQTVSAPLVKEMISKK